MTIKRTLCFESEGRLFIKDRQLVFSAKSGVEHSVPVEDIALVVLENQHVSVTAYALDALVREGVAIIVCDGSHMPSGQMLPFVGHTETQHVAEAQLNTPKTIKDQLWKQIVVAKIRNQAECLRRHGLHGSAELDELSKFLHGGDPENREGQAAALYFRSWGIVRRSRTDEENPPMPNPALNYGYAILRAAMARALAGSGLLCLSGIHHHGKYDPFVLADDLMEPYRPFIDDAVLAVREERKSDAPWDYIVFDRDFKVELLKTLACDVRIGGGQRPLLNALVWTSASLADCFEQRETHLRLPEFAP